MPNSRADKYDDYDAVMVATAIGVPYKQHGRTCTISCYNTAAHKNGDRKPSLVIYGLDKGYYCFACGESGKNSWLLKQFGVRDDEPYIPAPRIKRPAPVEPKLETSSDEYCRWLQALWEQLPPLPERAVTAMARKGFSQDMLETMSLLSQPLAGWRWHTNEIEGWSEGIFIPYIVDGKMVTARLRRLESSGPRFLSMPNNSMYPYNLDALNTSETVLVAEGETDCLTLNLLSDTIPAIGIPGATSGNAMRRLIAKAREKQTKLLIVPDNDEAGTRFALKMLTMATEANLQSDVLHPPLAKDINEWYLHAHRIEIDEFVFKIRYSQKVPQVSYDFF